MTLERLPKPQTDDEFDVLKSPLAREATPGSPCIIHGKIYNWSPLFFVVAFMTPFGPGHRKVSKKRVHITPCPSCPDYRDHTPR